MSQPELHAMRFAAELKFIGDPTESHDIGGYASVFNVLDANGDEVAPGAFDATLAEQKASGRVIPMFGEHSFAMLGGDPYPVGIWTTLTPDEKGLRVEGKFVSPGHPTVSRVRDLVKERAIEAMSIAFRVREGGAIFGKKAGEPLRRLTALDLYSVDLVGDPANPLARIDHIKSVMTLPNHSAAAAAIKQAFVLCADSLGGGNAPSKAQREELSGLLQGAHRELTGEDITLLHFEQLRELKGWMQRRKDLGGLGLSASVADDVAALLFKYSAPRDEADEAAARHAARKALVADLTGILSGFSLKPKD